jgi:four helix bundle protein
MSSEGLKRLDVWRKAEEFALLVYSQAVPALPVEEKWNLASQLRRSAQSIPANIAEGYGRYYYQDMVRFCYLARGSLDESLSHILLAQDLGYLKLELSGAIILAGDELSRLINGYIAYLKRSKQGANEPGAQQQIREAPESYLSDATTPPDGELL